MSVIQVTAKELPRALQKLAGEHKKAFRRGMYRAAQRGRTFIVRKTPVDTGELKASWKAKRGVAGSSVAAVLENDAPHVGIVEHGARPHPVSLEGFLNLVGWARRHGLGRSQGRNRTRDTSTGRYATRQWKSPYGVVFHGRDVAVAKAAYGIVRKIGREGQKPTYFIRNNLGQLVRIMKREVEDQLRRADRKAKR